MELEAGFLIPREITGNVQDLCSITERVPTVGTALNRR